MAGPEALRDIGTCFRLGILSLGLDRGAHQGHGHATGTAPSPGQLRGGDGKHLNPRVLHSFVGDIVAGVGDDLAWGNAEGVGTVVPLLTGRVVFLYSIL